MKKNTFTFIGSDYAIYLVPCRFCCISKNQRTTIRWRICNRF